MAENGESITSFSTNASIRGQISRTPDGKGLKAPDNIVKTILAARTLYNKFRVEHLKRIELIASIEGLIAGNAPYDAAELKKSGLGHIANFNNLDARSLYERGAQAFWNLLNYAETLVKFTINSEDPEARKMEITLAKEWDYVVRKWRSFTTLVNTLTGQLIKFGLSPVLWPDERDWRFRVIEVSKFMIPDQTQSDIDLLTCACVETNFTAQYLWEAYEFTVAEPDKSPWNKKELEQLLLHIANTYAKTSYEFVDFHLMQQRIQNGDIGFDVIFSDNIRIISLLYKEYDGKVSHYMFHRVFDSGDFLYFADRQYDSFDDALVIFTASPGEYTLHSNRGLGHKIYSVSQALMQLDCSIIDGARWASTPLIRGLSTGSRDAEVIRFYPGVPTNIGTAEFVQNNLGANIQPLIGVSGYFMQKLNNNITNAGDDPSIPDKSTGSISAVQAKMQSYKEFGVLKNNIAHFYNLFDRVIQNITVKMLNSKKGYPGYEFVKEWKDRCISKGVAPELFDMSSVTPWGMPKMLDVKATRVAGDGSTLANIMGLQELMPIAGDFGAREAQAFKRDWIIATRGVEQVSAYMQDADRVDEQAGGASLAGLENNAMQQGQGVIFSADNEHRSHVATHLALGMQVMQGMQPDPQTPQQPPQMDAITADKILTVLVPHIQQHMQALSKSVFAVGFLNKVKAPVDELIKFTNLNRHNAEKQMQAAQQNQANQAQQQQTMMTDEQRKDYVATKDQSRKDQQVAATVQRADTASAQRAQVMLADIERKAENERIRIQLDAQNKKRELDLKHSTEAADTNPIKPQPFQ